MLTYRVGFITSKGKPDAFLIKIDEYNNFGQEVVDIVNCIIQSDYDIKEVTSIDYIGEEDEEDA